MNKQWLFSYALWASSFLSFPLAAECVSTPDCADLGYDKTSCPSGDSVLKCPFDTSKLKCIPLTCEAIGKKTCGENCVPTGFTGCCTNSDCASGQTCNNHVCEDFCGKSPYAVGDIYCNAGGTPIGVVGHITNGGKNGVVVALDTAYDDKSGNGIQWGCYGTDLSLTNYSSHSSVLNDFAGKANTLTILNECSERPIAASYCASYTEGGVSGWYLPAYGELYAIMYTNFSTINTGLGKVSSNNKITSGNWYWSSSEYDGNSAWGYLSGNAFYGTGDKERSLYYVRCVLAF